MAPVAGSRDVVVARRLSTVRPCLALAIGDAVGEDRFGMGARRLELSRAQILDHRQAVGALSERIPPGADSLRRAAWAGLQDSMPRAALLSIHARVAAADPSAWEDRSLVQVWGPRFGAYVVAAADRSVFTLGRLPDDVAGRRFAEELADRLEALLDGGRMNYADAGRALGIHPNALRYAAPTGRVLLRWDGARRPDVWTVAAPCVDPVDARLELARRFLHVLGPGTAAAFGEWAGIPAARAVSAFDGLAPTLTPVRTPIGEAWILAEDKAAFLAPAAVAPVPARLLPSGDVYTLLWGDDRSLLVPDAEQHARLWTARVWPGALLVAGEIAGTWRRAGAEVSIDAWRRLSSAEREAVAAEAESLPLVGIAGHIRIDWGAAAG